MSRFDWTLGWYLCPDCGHRVEERGGPDGLHACRCSTCDWSYCFDPAADEWATKELDRIPTGNRDGWSA